MRRAADLRFRLDPGERAARRRPAVGRRRHGPADLPGRGPVVLDHLARATGGPDDHLVEQRRLLARTRPGRGPVLPGRRRRSAARLFRIAPGRFDGRVPGRFAVRRLWRLGRPAALVVVHRSAFALPRRPRSQHRHGPGQRALLSAAERVVAR